jgi:hypothetical protein
MIIERLKNKNFAFLFQCEMFSPASHILCPVKTSARFAYRAERRYPSECDANRKHAFDVSLNFLNKLQQF